MDLQMEFHSQLAGIMPRSRERGTRLSRPNYQAAGSTPGGALPSIPLSFSFATILPPEPSDFGFPGWVLLAATSAEVRPIASRHRLRSELRRYLIAFAPLTFVLD